MTDLQWAPTACILPTVERPMREREFTDLFRTALRAVTQEDPKRADFVLAPDAERLARELAKRETACCSFFAFTFTDAPDAVLMSVTVPAAHVAVLAALVDSASRDAGLTGATR
jgi:hypothetical protein